MRQIYKVAIEEHLVREVTVEADGVDDAIQNVIDAYKSEKIVLTAEDFTLALVSCIEPTPTAWDEID